MIHGVEIKELVTHTEARGFFREIIRGIFSRWPCAATGGGVLTIRMATGAEPETAVTPWKCF